MTTECGKTAVSLVVSADARNRCGEQIQDQKEAEMKKILIATDGSETALAAIDAGLELAAEEHAEVVFVHVTSLLELTPETDGHEAPERIPRAEADAALCEAVERAREHGITAKTELLIGYAPKQIVRLARDIDAELIVVGSRGLGRVKSAVFGSTSREVLAKADRPVMVVRETGVREPVGA
jgi:nucleotide-binding universal stress UspA family protein